MYCKISVINTRVVINMIIFDFIGYGVGHALSNFGTDKIFNYKTKIVILTCNLFYIGGSLLYWMGTISWCIILSRFLSGKYNVYFDKK